MGVGGQRHAPAALTPGKTRYPLYRAGVDGRGKYRLHRDSIPRTVLPVATRYTYRAIPAHNVNCTKR